MDTADGDGKRTTHRLFAACCAAAATMIAFSGCAKRKKVTVAPPPAVGSVEEGVASWYGYPYHGRASSSGEIYDMEKLTAAHRTWPFGTMVRVNDLDNGRTVDVRINDRGPFIDGRIIDLSRAAAREIQMIGPGTAKVRLRVLALPSAVPEGYFAVQVGAFRERANAERLSDEMRTGFGTAQVELRQGDPPVWRVLAGRESTPEAAEALAETLRAKLGAAFVVRVDAPPAH